MIPKLSQYRRIVGNEVIDNIRERAEPLSDKHAVHVNSTANGGGVAEILNTLVFLMNDVGIRTGWRVIFGSHSFFKITKGIHNSLQGKRWEMSPGRKKLYLEYCKRNAIVTHIKDHDIVVVHDPQPLGMITDYEKKTAWLWRCHIDISRPYMPTLKFLLPYIKRYDGVIVSHRKYMLKRHSKPQYIIPPSIDPLSVKNRPIPSARARRLLSCHGIDLDRPIITQISRFDPWKNPMGVVRMFQKIRRHADCQLVMMGDMASDDPEGPVIFHKIQRQNLENVKLITEKNDLLVNALQQESAIVMQNSVREGFAITVSEAMWKGTPVLGTPVGGIPLQIKEGRTGFLMRSEQDGVKKALRLLRDERLRKRIGQQAKEHVRQNFLITRHLGDYVEMFRKQFPNN